MFRASGPFIPACVPERMRLSALSIIVPDYDDAISFYCGVMGFTLVEDIDQGRKRWVRVQPTGGGASFILARADSPAQEAAIGQQGAGRVWLFPRDAGLCRRSCAPGVSGCHVRGSAPPRSLRHSRRLSGCFRQPLGPDPVQVSQTCRALRGQTFLASTAICPCSPAPGFVSDALPNGCGRSSGVEHYLAKVRVGRSNRLARSKFFSSL